MSFMSARYAENSSLFECYYQESQKVAKIYLYVHRDV